MKYPKQWWDNYFMGMATYTATASKDPSTKVGAVIVRPDKTIASMGYNGFPRGVYDDQALYEDREEKYKRVVHAEANAIVSGIERMRGYTIYCTMFPCCECAKLIIQAGITEVVVESLEKTERYYDSMRVSEMMFRQAGVRLREVGAP